MTNNKLESDLAAQLVSITENDFAAFTSNKVWIAITVHINIGIEKAKNNLVIANPGDIKGISQIQESIRMLEQFLGIIQELRNIKEEEEA